MADEQLGQILELVKGIAGKQEASEARLAATEARLEDMAREVKERQPVMVKAEDFGEDPGEGLSLEEAEEMLERQRKYVLGRRRGAKGTGSSMAGHGGGCVHGSSIFFTGK